MTEITWPGAQPLRHLADLTEIVGKLELSPGVREKSLGMLKRLAEAEAEAHGTNPDEVHFHAASAVDTLVDVVGAAWGLERLGIGDVVCRPLPWFGGFVDCEHGRLALPAPVTLALLKGKPCFESGAMEELITPTGALLLDTLPGTFISPARLEPMERMGGSLTPSGIFEKSGLAMAAASRGRIATGPVRGSNCTFSACCPRKMMKTRILSMKYIKYPAISTI